jgi:hypothetical protein
MEHDAVSPVDPAVSLWPGRGLRRRPSCCRLQDVEELAVDDPQRV